MREVIMRLTTKPFDEKNAYAEIVQELVRCRDCIYYRKSDKGHPDADWCKWLICGTIKPDFYCADGEGREK